MYHYLKLIQEIKKNPLIFLGKPSIELLRAFLNGAVCYMHFRYPEELKKLNALLRDFWKFVDAKFNNNQKTLSAEGIIKEYVGDDEQAIWLFFKVWDEFLAQPDVAARYLNEMEKPEGDTAF